MLAHVVISFTHNQEVDRERRYNQNLATGMEVVAYAINGLIIVLTIGFHSTQTYGFTTLLRSLLLIN